MPKTGPHSQEQILRRTIQSAAVLIIVGNAAIMAWWIAGGLAPELFAVGPTNMRFNTALAFAAAGVGLLGSLSERTALTAATGGLVLVLGLGVLLQYGGVPDIGLNELFVRDHTNPATTPGLMAVGTALGFTLAGAQLLIAAARGWRHLWGTVAMEVISFLVFALGAAGMIGFVDQLFYPYVPSGHGHARMATETALSFITLGVGLMSLAWYGQRIPIARIPLWLAPLLCLCVLLADIATPAGVAIGIAYVPLVFCSLWFTRPHVTLVLAIIGCVLCLVALIAKPTANIATWIVVANRALAIGAIVFVAMLVYLRRRSEWTLAQSRSRLKAVVDHAVDGLITIDEKGIVEHFNPACERLFGYQAAEVIGRNICMLMPEPDRGRHDTYLARYLATGQGEIIGTPGREVMAMRKDGTVFPMDLAVSAFHFEDGLHFSGIVRDISARKKSELDLLRYTNALERSNKELDDFAYVASHDLKEPLRGLSSHAQFLEEDYESQLDDAGTKRLHRMRYLSQRMEHLVNDLLYFSRLGRQELAIVPTDLNAVVHDVTTMMEATLDEEQVTVNIATPLPEVVCDRARVTEVFRNLITNAVKYNDKENKIIEIGYIPKMHTDVGVEHQVFYIKDNGIGIEKQFFEDVFRMFKRLNVEDDARKGDGVGLAFVRKIIERHNGRIWIASVPGEGTTFYFTLSQRAAANAAA
jgi:PAS domain S-box-containing protein